jgi:hypothetical protein
MELAKIKAVKPAKAPLTLNVTWEDDSKSRVDLTGLVHSSRHFGVFADDHVAFRRARIVNYGSGIEWPNGLDFSAQSLKILADEQRPMTGEDLDRFQSGRHLNIREIANILDCSERTIRDYKRFAKKELPKTWAITIRQCERDQTVFSAHYRPVAVKPRGRPKAAR